MILNKQTEAIFLEVLNKQTEAEFLEQCLGNHAEAPGGTGQKTKYKSNCYVRPTCRGGGRLGEPPGLGCTAPPRRAQSKNHQQAEPIKADVSRSTPNY